MKTLEQYIISAQQKVADVMDANERVVIAFSGGKDSLAVLRLFYPYRDRVTVATADTGKMWPHMVAFIKEQCADYRLHVVRSDQAAQWRSAGIPSRIVPVYNHATLGFRMHAKGNRTLMTDWTSCHHQLVDLPMHNYANGIGASIVALGQRDDEGYMKQPKAANGYSIFEPISEWTAEIVFAYLKSEGITPAKQYPELSSSLDCWNCPAHTTADTIRFMERENPELLPELRSILRAHSDAIGDAVALELPAIKAAGIY